MSVSESCGCGGSFSADRPKDELRLLNLWRSSHVCFVGGDLVVTGSGGVVESAPDFTDKNLHIGFRGQEFDDD
jgi:hypothetical protein